MGWYRTREEPVGESSEDWDLLEWALSQDSAMDACLKCWPGLESLVTFGLSGGRETKSAESVSSTLSLLLASFRMFRDCGASSSSPSESLCGL